MANQLIDTNIAGKIAIQNGYFTIKPSKRGCEVEKSLLSLFDANFGQKCTEIKIQFPSSEVDEVFSKSLQLRHDNNVYAEIIGNDIYYYISLGKNRECRSVGFTVSELGGIDSAKIYTAKYISRLFDVNLDECKWQKSIRLRFIILWEVVECEHKIATFDYFSQSQRTIAQIQSAISYFDAYKHVNGKSISDFPFKLQIEMIDIHPSVKLIPV